jgi:inorganic pyrophosphatase
LRHGSSLADTVVAPACMRARRATDQAGTMARRSVQSPTGLAAVPTWHGDLVRVVIETPKNQPNKMKYDEELGVVRLSKVLPVAMVFPFDFGFLPGTAAPDGDPLDVLVLMDAPVWPGCVVETRLIGVLRCEQGEAGGKQVRNDRLIGVASDAKTYGAQDIADLDDHLVDEIEAFFVDYNRVNGRAFRVLKSSGRRAARRTVRDAARPASRRRA